MKEKMPIERNTIPSLDSLKNCTKGGADFWFARDIQKHLGVCPSNRLACGFEMLAKAGVGKT